ncbi:MAG: hypothetical protein L3J26_00535 [Candidatus Polarisedimenticolaceae bacterium]|nr:hypothetical protein [Candidatus Polarisedimenticolaceae bacterium]
MFETPPLKINFYKITPLLLLLGALSLWSCVVVDSYFVLIPIASFILLLALMITYKKANEIVFELIPRLGFLYAILASLAVTLLSAALLLISAEAVHIDNTLNGINMLRISMLLGAPAGVMTWVLLSKRIGYKNIFMLKSFLISYALVAAAATSQINRGVDDAEQKTIVRGVMGKKENSGGLATFLAQQKPAHYITIPYDGGVERLAVPTSVWDTMYKNATINLTAKAGYFGYDYVVRFNGRTL